MEAACRTLKGLLILGSCLLLSSEALLPKLRNSDRFWKHKASQYPSPEGSINLKTALIPWDIRVPSIALRDWSLEWMSSDVMAPRNEGNEDKGQNRESRLWIPTRKGTLPPQSQKRTLYSAGWVPGWDEKRSMVVADDTAFREKSKMLTTMERQKWLNSYMQKFRVVNSK